jgi:phosphinothricin acetyltransferase
MTRIRPVSVDDATQIAAIYEPMVRQTAVSFELEPPTPDEMARRIESVSADHPWIVMEDEGALVGYAYATDFRQRPAYRWSTETTIYLDGDRQGRGLGKILYNALLEVAILWGYANALAGIALPNPASEAPSRRSRVSTDLRLPQSRVQDGAMARCGVVASVPVADRVAPGADETVAGVPRAPALQAYLR